MQVTGIMGITMDKEKFARLQRANGWFGATFLMRFPPFDPQKTIDDVLADRSVSQIDLHRLMFGLTFGSYNIKIDLKAAEAGCKVYLKEVQKRGFSGIATVQNPSYLEYLSELGMWDIQLGTVYAYLNEPVKAAYHLIRGLKKDGVNLFMPYCDFIRCVLAELEDLPKQRVTVRGRGGSAANPMGFHGGSALDASVAMNVIPLMEGLNDEVLIAKRGHSYFYGHLIRCGSTSCREQPNCIDIYETWLIDRAYQLKTLQLYFDGYMPVRGVRSILLPEGFDVPSYVRESGPWCFV